MRDQKHFLRRTVLLAVILVVGVLSAAKVANDAAAANLQPASYPKNHILLHCAPRTSWATLQHHRMEPGVRRSPDGSIYQIQNCLSA